MGKKGKGGGDAGGANKDEARFERETALIIRVGALEEQLANALRERDNAVKVSTDATKILQQQDQDRKDQVEYLKEQLENVKKTAAELETKLASTELAKGNQAQKLEDMKTRLAEDMSEREKVLAEKEGEVAKLNAQLVELGQLKANAVSDAALKESQGNEVEDLRARLRESQQQLNVLAVANDPTVSGDDGSRVVPLMLLEVVRSNPTKAVLVEQGLIALQYVLSGDRQQDAVLVTQKGAVQATLMAMDLHQELPDLQSAACGFLWKLAFSDATVRDLVIQNNGLPLIMGAMQRHTSHSRLHYNACGAMRQILVTAPTTFSTASQLQGSPVRMADGHHHHSELPSIQGGRRNAPSRRSGVGGPRMGSRNAPAGLRGTNSNPSLPKHGQGGGSQSLERPSTTSYMGSPSARRDYGVDSKPATKEDVALQALKLTLRSMHAHTGTSLVQEYGCGTLYNLVVASPSVMRARVTAEGGVPITLGAMRSHPMAAGVQLNACALIKELAEYQPCLTLLDEGGARALLVASMNNHQLNDDLLARASEALRYLPDHESAV